MKINELRNALTYFKTLWKKSKKKNMTLQGSINNLKKENEFLKNENIRLKNENDQLKIQKDLLNADLNNFIERNVLEENRDKIEETLKDEDMLEKWKYIKLMIDDVKWDMIQMTNQVNQINNDSAEIKEDIKGQIDRTLEILLKTGFKTEGIIDFSEEFHNLFDD